MTEYVVAVDMGGTKVAAALVSRDGQLGQQFAEPTSQTGPADGLQQIIRLCQQATGDRGGSVVGVGVGIPAVLENDTDLVIWAPNIQGWRNVGLKPALEDALGIPATIEYDGHTAVLGEWWIGAGRGARTLVDIIIGTGIGGGIIADGRLLRGQSRLAGAAGWFALTTQDSDPSDGLAQGIGHWESLAAGPGISRRAVSGLASAPDSVLQRIPPDQITSREVFSAAHDGDEYARWIVNETAGIIGLGVANVISLINPDCVVLGGSVGCQGELLLPRVREVVKRWAQPASADAVTIVSSELGADAGLLGAAYAAFTRDI